MYNEINQYDFILECNRFIEDNIAAPYIAFYLSKGYSLDALGQGTFMQHFNSAADVFNIDFNDIGKIITDIKQILIKKYLLEVIEENPLKLCKKNRDNN